MKMVPFLGMNWQRARTGYARMVFERDSWSLYFCVHWTERERRVVVVPLVGEHLNTEAVVTLGVTGLTDSTGWLGSY